MLLDDIKRGESDRLEFKETPNRESSKWLKTVVAFANCRGGRIVFGVKNSRKVVGLEGDLFAMKDGNSVRLVVRRPARSAESDTVGNMGGNNMPNTMSRDTVNGIVNGTVNEAELLFAAIEDNPGHRMPFFVELLKKSDRTLKRYLIAELKERVEFRGAPKTGGYYVKEAKHG